jgi:hypothetical protein
VPCQVRHENAEGQFFCAACFASNRNPEVMPATGLYQDRGLPGRAQTTNVKPTASLIAVIVVGVLIVLSSAVLLLMLVSSLIFGVALAGLHLTGGAGLGVAIWLLIWTGWLAVGIGILRLRETARVIVIAVCAIQFGGVALISLLYYEFAHRVGLSNLFVVPQILVGLGIPAAVIVLFTRSRVKALFT